MGKRKSGFYWVWHIAEWEIGYFSDRINIWTLTGDKEFYNDEDFKYIKETRITNEPSLATKKQREV